MFVIVIAISIITIIIYDDSRMFSALNSACHMATEAAHNERLRESHSSFPHSPIRLIPDQSLTLILKTQYHGGVRWHAQVTRLGCAPLIYSIFTTDMLLHVTDLSSSLLLTVWLLFLWVLAWPRCRGAFWRDFYFDSKASGWSKKVIFIKVNSRAGHFLNEMAIWLPKISHLSGADKLNVQWWGSQ